MEKAKSSFQTAATTEELGKMELPTGLVFLAQPTVDVQKASSKMANGKEEWRIMIGSIIHRQPVGNLKIIAMAISRQNLLKGTTVVFIWRTQFVTVSSCDFSIFSTEFDIEKLDEPQVNVVVNISMSGAESFEKEYV